MLIEGQAVHLLKTTGSYTDVYIPNQRSVRSRGWGKSQVASTPLTCCGPFRTLAALELGGKAKSPPGRWMKRAPCQMIWMNLAEPRAGKRDCPSGSDFPPEGSEMLLYMSLVASSALCSNAVNMAAITHSSFHLFPYGLHNQPHIPTLQISE